MPKCKNMRLLARPCGHLVSTVTNAIHRQTPQTESGGVSRDRLHMLLAAFSCLHGKLHEAGEPQRCQVVQTAIALFANKFQALLLGASQASQAAASGQPPSWQQVPLNSINPAFPPGLNPKPLDPPPLPPAFICRAWWCSSIVLRSIQHSQALSHAPACTP